MALNCSVSSFRSLAVSLLLPVRPTRAPADPLVAHPGWAAETWKRGRSSMMRGIHPNDALVRILSIVLSGGHLAANLAVMKPIHMAAANQRLFLL